MTYEYVEPVGVDTVLKLPARGMPELSGLGSVFIYFDSLSNTVLSSQNGSVYAPLVATTLQGAYDGGSSIVLGANGPVSITGGSPAALVLGGNLQGVQPGVGNGQDLGLAGGLAALASGTGGAIVMRTAPAASGTTLVDRLKVTADGAEEFEGIPTASAPALSPSGTGRFYFNSTLNQFLVSSNGGAYMPLSAGGSTSLNGAYNFGAPGGGRTIDANAGAVQVLSSSADNNNLLEIAKTPAGAQSGAGLEVTMGANTTGPGIQVMQSGTGFAIDATGNCRVTGKLTVTGVIDPTQVLLTGADKRFGATDAGTVYLAPFANSTTGVQVRRADNVTAVVTVDTTNSRVGIGTSAPTQQLEVAGSVQIGTNLVVTGSATINNNLTVNGTTTTVNTTNLAITDPLLYINAGAVGPSPGGLAIDQGGGLNLDQVVAFIQSSGRFEIGQFDTSGGTVVPSSPLATLTGVRLLDLSLAGTTITADAGLGITATGANLTLFATGLGQVQLGTNGSARWTVDTTGNLLAATDNAQTIGTSGANRPSSGFFATSVVAGPTASAVTISSSLVSSASLLTVRSASAAGGSGLAGTTCSMVAGNGDGAGAGAVCSMAAGNGGLTGNGGNSTITGGFGGATSGNAGGVSISGGTVPASGNGGTVTLTATAGVGTNKNGGNVTVQAGASTGSGSPGAVSLTGGTGGGTVLGSGGAAIIGSNGAGGLAQLSGGNGDGSGTGGQAAVTGGTAGTTGLGGQVTITAGGGGATSGAGGAVTVTGGTANGGNSPGGNVTVQAGTSHGTGTGPTLSLLGGTGGTGGLGGNVVIAGGSTGGATAAGGTVSIATTPALGTSTTRILVLATGLVGFGQTPTSTVHVNGSFAHHLASFSGGSPVTLNATLTVAIVDATAGATTVNLPAASAATDRIYHVKKSDSSANAVTVTAAGGDTIDGAATQALVAQYESIQLVSDGTNWWLL